MKRWVAVIVGVIVAAFAGVALAWWRGVVSLPFGPSHHELEIQLRDRGPVAVAGRIPFGLHRDGTPFVDADSLPELRSALAGTDGVAAARAMRNAHLDGLMVRTDRTLGAPSSLLRRLSDLRAVDGIAASYLDDTAALYETHEPIAISPDDARRLVGMVRLVLQGAVPPPDRLFPPAVRRAYPTEVAVIVRDGASPVLWRAVRGGSIARALIDATYAVLDRWTTRQQMHYGPLRDAINTHPITIAIFHDRGTLGTRTPEFIRRAVDRRTFSIGYELRGNWEYVLPPTPGAPIADPVRALQGLARDHDLPAPGYLRPEVTVYRFRAFQLIERDANGAVDIDDPK